MRPRTLIVALLVGLALGLYSGPKRSDSTRSDMREHVVPPALSDLTGQQDKIRQLESDLIAARKSLVAVNASNPGARSGLPSEARGSEGGRLQAFQLLKAQGASIGLSIFDGRTPAGMNQSAKSFFGLTEEEAAKASEAMAAARRAVDVATSEATITASTGNSVTLTVPPAENPKEIRAQLAVDLAAAIGPEHAEELLEIGDPELDRVLRGYGSRERSITVTRILPPTSGPPGFVPMQYRLSERYPNGGMGTSFNNPAEREEFAWLSRFTPQLEALVGTGR